MILLIHITLAISSILFAVFTAFKPSQKKLTISYLITLSMLVSAGVLVIQTHTSIGHACLSGLTFLGLTSIILVIAHKRLALEEAK